MIYNGNITIHNGDTKIIRHNGQHINIDGTVVFRNSIRDIFGIHVLWKIKTG